MYEAFYGLRDKPFNLTPDPRFLFLSDKHKEAFAHLLFGIKNRSGFVMVTGEIGTGKTTICRNLLNQLDEDTELAFVFNPSLNPTELLKKICSEFGVDTAHDNVLDLTEDLNTYLLEAARAGKNCVLVIDEAQNLSPAVLEQIRLLSNLETESEKLLQIILIGQPELLEQLSLHELRQLNQRITARYHLKALSEQETLQYIAYRLHVAGGRKKVHFARAAIRAVYKHSGGTPRVINAICDRALLIGYTKEAHIINAQIIKRAANEITGETIRPQKKSNNTLKKWLPSPAMLLTAILIVLLIKYFAIPLERTASELGVFNSLLTATTPSTLPSNTPAPSNNTGASTQKQAPSTHTTTTTPTSPLAEKLLQHFSAVNSASTTQTNDFKSRFSTWDADTMRNVAADTLLRKWNIAPLGEWPAENTAQALNEFIEQHGLACEILTPAIDQLLAIGMPAFVQLRVGDTLAWTALLAKDETKQGLTITTNTKDTYTLSRDLFARYYAGKAVIPWRDPKPKMAALLPGQANGNVQHLKEQLLALGRISPNNVNDRYDTQCASAIARIQAETGLLVDGIAGKQVRMVLTSWTNTLPTPALHQNVAVTAARPHTAPMPEEKPETAKEIPEATEEETTVQPVSEPLQQKQDAVEEPEAPASENDESPTPKKEEKALEKKTPVVVTMDNDTVRKKQHTEIEQKPVTALAESLPKPDEKRQVQVQELPAPLENTSIPESNTHLTPKETTPPALGNAPLIPHVSE